MLRILLIRHGQSSANVSGTLAGRLPGVALSPAGQQQALDVAEALAHVHLADIVASPMQRTVQTARTIAGGQTSAIAVRGDKAFAEIDFGDWSGSKLTKLVKDPKWNLIQTVPSTVTFPNGESMTDALRRSTAGIEKLVARQDALTTTARDGKGKTSARFSTVAVVSHADIIKMLIAHTLGLHLDLFQRIQVEPGSTSALVLGTAPPRVEFMNVPASGLAAALGGVPQDSAPGGSTGRSRSRK